MEGGVSVSDLRIREFPISLGRLPTGANNSITDIAGVRVGHCTVNAEAVRTGVTVIVPCEDNPFTNKLTAATYVQNGFGKSVGLMQIDELGSLETPIALTNTLNVGKVSDALNQYILDRCKAEGVTVQSINPVVGECNDSKLNDISQRVINCDEVKVALDRASKGFEQGDVGAGRSTVCFGFKGGIGSASRLIEVNDQSYAIGVLVQSNFGATEDFVLQGQSLGQWWLDQNGKLTEEAHTSDETSTRRLTQFDYSECDQGSIMVIVATDLPVNSRQLKRIIKHAAVGIMRTGAYVGHGSGEVMIGFTTANRKPHEGPDFQMEQVIREDALNPAFLGVAEATYEAILNSLIASEGAITKDGHGYVSFKDVLMKWLNRENH